MSATELETSLVEYFQNWINTMHALSKRLLDDNQFLASGRIRRLFLMMAIQEQRAHVIQYFCRSQKNCQICSKIQEYKALVSKTKQDLKEVVENILHWQSNGIGLIESVDYFIQYLKVSNFEEVSECGTKEEDDEFIKMEELCAIEENERCSSQEQNQCNRMEEGCTEDVEKCNTGEEGNTAENNIFVQHFSVTSGKVVKMDALKRMYYKINYMAGTRLNIRSASRKRSVNISKAATKPVKSFMFEKSREKHYHHICSILDIIATFDQMSKVKNEILQLAKEMM